MPVLLDRRAFCAASASAVLAAGQAASAQPVGQTFVAGLVPTAPRPPGQAPAAPRPDQSDEERFRSYLVAMDDAARLGVRNIERSNPAVRFADYYAGRENQFKDELARRNQTLVGMCNNAHPGDPAQRATLIAENVRTSRFVKAMGGRYVCVITAPIPSANGTVANNGAVADFVKLDFKTVAAALDEAARIGREETGIELGVHPEYGDASAGLLPYLMESTQHLRLFADIGWMQQGGLDAVALCKKYHPKLIGLHLRDVAPRSGPDKPAIVPLGQGSIDLQGLVAYLREQRFTGCVMGEGSTNQANHAYMRDTLGLRF